VGLLVGETVEVARAAEMEVDSMAELEVLMAIPHTTARDLHPPDPNRGAL
jgi:hypothetical protein